MQTDSLITRIDKLPKIPKVVQELMDLVNNEQSDLNQIAEKISMDQVISARVLRLSNSAHFGRARTVSSIDEAVIRLGLGPIRTLVIASALMSAFPKVEGLDLNNFWGTTFEVASLSKAISSHVKEDPNEAFTAGMLHNIGDLLIYTVAPDEAQKIELHVEAGKTKQEAQQLILNTDTAQLGGELANNWKFADTLVQAIANQFAPVSGESFSKMAAILRLANKIENEWDEVVTTDSKVTWLNSQLEYSMLGLSESVVETIDDNRGKGREMASSVV